MTPLRPVPGSAPGVRALADALEGSGRRLGEACRDLVRLRDAAVWDGPAGEAFAARVGAAPAVLDRAARRHLGAVAPLRVFADALDVEQGVAQRCVDEHAAASDAYVVLEDRAAALVGAGLPETSPELLAVRYRQQEEAAAVARAEQRHRAALDRLEAADARCSSALRALADDPLADPVVYRGLRAASTTGHDVGTLAGAPSRLFPTAAALGTVGEVVGTGADAALLAGYGDGDVLALAAGAVGAALGTGGQALRAGATAGAVRRADGAVVAVTRLSVRERLVVGSVRTVRDRLAAARARFDVPPERATASALVGGPSATATATTGSLRERAVRAARARYDGATTGLALASAGGTGTRRMYAAGVTLSAAGAAAPRVVER